MPVGTQQLAFVRVAAAGGTTVYRPPAGYRAIVKTILLYPEGAGVTASVLAVSGPGAVVSLMEATFVQALAPADRSGLWVVLREGDRIQLNTSSAVGVHVLISGTELQLGGLA